MKEWLGEYVNEGSRERQNDQVGGRNKCSGLLVPWFPNYGTFRTAPRYGDPYCVRRSTTAAAAFKEARKLWKVAFGKKSNF
jgi:hypothetical protein